MFQAVQFSMSKIASISIFAVIKYHMSECLVTIIKDEVK
jgi:hypothetical protein